MLARSPIAIATLSLLLASALAASSAPGGGDFSGNPIPLHNGAEGYFLLSIPYLEGDAYYKVWPGETLRSPSGVMSINGLDFLLGDQDWTDGSRVWDLAIYPAIESPTGAFVPDTSQPPLVFLPGFEVDLGITECPEQLGFELRIVFVFIDPETGETSGTLLDLVADGEHDYALMQFFPEGESITDPPLNNCGTSGNASLNWASSSALFGTTPGEHQADWLDTGRSAYAGFRSGDSPAGEFFQVELEESPVVTLLFDQPTLNVRVDAGLEAEAFEEVGLAGLNLPLGITASGLVTGQTARLGVELYDDQATPGLTLGLAFATLAAPLNAPGELLGGETLLDPLDPLFAPSFRSFELGFFQDLDTLGDIGFRSQLIPIDATPALIDTQIHLQGHSVEPVGMVVRSTNVVSMTLRASD